MWRVRQVTNYTREELEMLWIIERKKYDDLLSRYQDLLRDMKGNTLILEPSHKKLKAY